MELHMSRVSSPLSFIRQSVKVHLILTATGGASNKAILPSCAIEGGAVEIYMA